MAVIYRFCAFLAVHFLRYFLAYVAQYFFKKTTFFTHDHWVFGGGFDIDAH